jgi:tetratricopeptide (TPR) repeat protein
MTVGLPMLDIAVSRLDSIPLRDRPYFAIAMGYAQGGKPANARAVMARYDAEVKDTVLRRVRSIPAHRTLGIIATAEGRYDEAIRELRAADLQYDGLPSECPVCMLPDLAHAYDLAGNADSAIAVFERYVNSRYAYRASAPDPRYLAGSYKRLGELYDARGDRERAATNYTKFIELWKDADPELQPKVQDARQRLARIGHPDSRP